MLLFNIEIADPSIESIVQSSFANHIFSSRVFSSLFQVIKLCAHFLIYLHCTLARSKYRAFVEIVAYILWHRRKKKWSSMQQEVANHDMLMLSICTLYLKLYPSLKCIHLWGLNEFQKSPAWTYLSIFLLCKRLV